MIKKQKRNKKKVLKKKYSWNYSFKITPILKKKNKIIKIIMMSKLEFHNFISKYLDSYFLNNNNQKINN